MKFKWKKMVSALLVVAFMVLSISEYTGSIYVQAAERNSVTIHFKSEWDGANIFYWNQNGGYNNPTRWSGNEMSEEGDDWYCYTFEDTQKVTFMFNYEGSQTKHFTKTSGEYWYVSDTWYNHKPMESEITPTPTPKPTATPKPTSTNKPTQEPTVAPTKALEPTRAVAPTAAPQVTIAESDKSIKIHYRGEQKDVKLFYWNVNYGTNTPVAWPGTAMIFKGNNWFEYTIPNAEAANLIFVTEAGETEELYVLDGEWWYVDGEIMDYNPYGDELIITTAPITMIPVPTVTIAPVVTEVPIATEKPVVPTEPAATPTAEPTAEPTVEPTAIPTTAPTATPKPVVKGKIVVHFYSTSASMNIHYWEAAGASESQTTWPGNPMTSEGNNWYTYTIEGATSASMLFNCNSNKETDDLTGVKEGEWWYKNNQWYDYDPSGPTPTPGPTSTPRPTNTPRPTRDPNLPTPTPVPRDADWDFRDETIYFLITTRFYDGDPSNNEQCQEQIDRKHDPSDPAWRGDFKGLIEKLDYIKALGFTAIWITPVVENDSGYDYHGYHAYDFSKVDSRYESDGATYQDLIDACHEKGMKIIQDVVWNHTCNWGEENLLQIDNPVYAGGRSKMVMPDGSADDPDNIYHHNGFCGGSDWDLEEAQTRTIADDCFDLQTENPLVYNYLIDCYTDYINMGVDAFRVDTVKHISRLTLNATFVPAMKEAGGEDFYMFGEVCTKGHNVWYREQPPISTCFYTWADDELWLGRWSETDLATNEALVHEHYESHKDMNNQPTSDNAFLKGNEYHEPDYSQKSGLDVIDFQMHWSFIDAQKAFNTAKGEDAYFNDSTWNVVYVDSHDFGPDEEQKKRYNKGTEAWAENLSLMFTFRGIPCIFYESEIEFQADKLIDPGPAEELSATGRAYYGDNITGNVTATGFSEYTADGTVADTLNQPLAKHLQRLNKIRAAVPALRKGQYSTENVSGSMAYKRRYTSDTIDSFVCVTVTDGATFTGLPEGTYTDVVTGDVQTIPEGGTLTIAAPGKGNLRAYVLDTALTAAPGQVGAEIDSPYLH